jgi:hypothetical protein
MRRRKTKKTISEVLKKEVAQAVRRVMDNRHVLLAPFPLDPLDIYRRFWSEEEWQALKILQHRDGLVSTGRYFYMTDLPILRDAVHSSITVNLPSPQPICSGSTARFRMLPAAMQDAIVEWGKTWVQLQQDTVAVVARLEMVAQVCTTYGHVHRLWPQLASFLPEVGRKKLAAAKVQSAYPEEALMFKGSKTLKREFEPAMFSAVNTVLAEALMLPEGDRVHVAVVN